MWQWASVAPGGALNFGVRVFGSGALQVGITRDMGERWEASKGLVWYGFGGSRTIRFPLYLLFAAGRCSLMSLAQPAEKNALRTDFSLLIDGESVGAAAHL